jgi:hypothetical protein
MAQVPARRRITPVAITSCEAAITISNDAEDTLCPPPVPKSGSSKAISASGRGRRIWVDITGSLEVSFREVSVILTGWGLWQHRKNITQ